MDIEGKVHKIMPQVSGASQKGNWVKQDVIIEQNTDFNKKVCITLWGDKVNELSRFSEGDNVTLGINLESREYNGRWYTEARAWKITGQSSTQQSNDLPPLDNTQQQFVPADDNMPF